MYVIIDEEMVDSIQLRQIVHVVGFMMVISLSSPISDSMSPHPADGSKVGDEDLQYNTKGTVLRLFVISDVDPEDFHCKIKLIMPLTSDLKLDASKFNPASISEKTQKFNDGLIKIMQGGPLWYEVSPRHPKIKSSPPPSTN